MGPDEQAYLDAIKASPEDQAAHLAYADWLDAQGRGFHAAALRNWTNFVREPLMAAGGGPVRQAYYAYRHALYREDSDWIEAVDGVRRWIGKRVAEKMARLFLEDCYGITAALTWTIKVERCMFDERWSCKYEGTIETDHAAIRQKGTVFIDQIFGSNSGHVIELTEEFLSLQDRSPRGG